MTLPADRDEMTAEEYQAYLSGSSVPVLKYHNTPCEEDGYRFASRAERTRYRELKQLRDAGEITDLGIQTPFRLEVNGHLIAKYLADFTYTDADGRRHVEDVKGVRTDVYKLKRRLMKAIHGIEIEEIT